LHIMHCRDNPSSHVVCCTVVLSIPQAVREQRMAQELAAAKRERDFYLSRVDRAKALDAMQQRRQTKQQQQPADAPAAAAAVPAAAYCPGCSCGPP
jgi:ESF2/ABP1 family protein